MRRERTLVEQLDAEEPALLVESRTMSSMPGTGFSTIRWLTASPGPIAPKARYPALTSGSHSSDKAVGRFGAGSSECMTTITPTPYCP